MMRNWGLQRRIPRALLLLAAWAIVLAMIAIVVEPFFDDLSRWGFHDWDSTTASRLLTVISLKRYGQFPFWNPYACGGYSAWGYVEGGTTVVSPWLPIYLALPIQIALRVEVVGTAILSAVGTWLLAGRFTRSIAARTLVCVLFVVNGRWALQTASGHLWHCYYAYMPWVLYFYERAHGFGRSPFDSPPRWRDAVFAGGFLALMVYSGAIYPLPHTAFVLGAYGLLLAIVYRSWRPLLSGGLVLLALVGLSAPKLLPVLDAFSRSPRLTDSPEKLDLTGFLTLLTSRDQAFGSSPMRMSHWGWHEWGMYLGWVPVLLLSWGVVYAGWQQKRERVVKVVGIVVLFLGFGSFHEYAPWPLLRQLPVFSSQHVPSRWLYPALLLLALPTAAGLGRFVANRGRRSWLVEWTMLAGITWVALDMASVSQLALRRVFWMQLPPITEQAQFRQHANVPRSLHYVVRDWAVPAVPAMLSNAGVLECYGVASLAIYWRQPDGTIPGQGARGLGTYDYRGEAYTASGEGRASIVEWSPNRVTVRVEGAQAGDTLVLNQNFDPSWLANDNPAFSWKDAVATTLPSGDTTITFRYWPRRQWAGLAIFGLTIASLGGAWVLDRRRRKLPVIAPTYPIRRNKCSPAALPAASSPDE